MESVRVWTPYNGANPSHALILLLWWLSPRSAQHTTTLWEGESTYGQRRTWCMCVNTSHTSLHHLMPAIHETRRSMSFGPPSMIKSSEWWPIAFHCNGPPPDIIIKPGRTQLSNGLPNVKRRHSQNIDLVREAKRLEKHEAGNQSRFNSYLMNILDPAADLNAKRFFANVKCQKKYGCRVAYVFNVDNDSNIPDLVRSPYDFVPNIDILSGVKHTRLLGLMRY